HFVECMYEQIHRCTRRWVAMTGSVDGPAVSPDTSLGDLLQADLPVQLAALDALGSAIATADIQDERDRYGGPELGEASIRLHRICSQLTGKRYQWLLAEEADGRWATSAFRPRTFASHVAQSHHISYANAHHTIRLARQLRDAIPRFGAALRAGQVGPDHIEALATTALTSPTRIAALTEPVASAEAEGEDTPAVPNNDLDEPASTAGGHSSDPSAQHSQSVEDFLLEQARQLTVNQVRRLGRHFAQVADPEADERGYRKTKEREYLELVRTLDGWHLSGFLTEENGRLIRTAMEAVMSPPAPDDHRTGDQRRAQALADVAHLVLDQGLAGTHASVPPHLAVLIGPADIDPLLTTAHEPHQCTPDSARSAGASWETPALADLAGIDWATRLREKPPTFDDGTGPVPPDLLRRLATCGGIYRAPFSPESELTNHGRQRRPFTPAQRRALIARDKGCTWPGCTAPPAICEPHHARIHWAHRGPTNTTTGALLCYHPRRRPRHHHDPHQRHLDLHPTRRHPHQPRHPSTCGTRHLVRHRMTTPPAGRAQPPRTTPRAGRAQRTVPPNAAMSAAVSVPPVDPLLQVRLLRPDRGRVPVPGEHLCALRQGEDPFPDRGDDHVEVRVGPPSRARPTGEQGVSGEQHPGLAKVRRIEAGRAG